MVTLSRIKLLFLFLALGVFSFACSDDSGDVITDITIEIPASPSNLQATSLDATTIRIRFDASSDEGATFFVSYNVTVSAPDGTIAFESAPTNTTDPVDATGLTEGIIYDISVVSVGTDGNSTSIDMQWSPATRFTEFPDGNGPIQMFETSSLFGSGLMLFDAVEGGPAGLRVSSGEMWDMGIIDDDGENLRIGSPSLLGYQSLDGLNLRMTYISSSVIENVESLDDVFDSQALDAGTEQRVIDLGNYSSNIVFIAQTQIGTADSHFAKVFVDYNEANNSFWFDSEGENVVRVHISYQRAVDVPYAIQAGGQESGAND